MQKIIARKFNILITMRRRISCEDMIGIHAYVTHYVYRYIICGMCSQQHAVLATVKRRSRSSSRDNDLSYLSNFIIFLRIITRNINN